MKNVEFAKLCSQYAMALGLEMGANGAVTEKIAISIPKSWIRRLCDKELDNKEYETIRDTMFLILEEVASDSGWGNVILDERGTDYTLTFCLERTSSIG